MPSPNDYMWKFFEGRVYDHDEIKKPYVVPVIEQLPYETDLPVAIDVGGGNLSIVHSARLPRPRYFRTATVDLAAQTHGFEPLNPTITADIDDLIASDDDSATGVLTKFLAECAAEGQEGGADLLVYSEILNYVDFRSTMHWFDRHLKPGGFTVIANLPTRGWSNLFSKAGVRSHADLISFVQQELGHQVVRQEYPWDATDNYEGFMVLATQKPLNF